MHYTSIHRCYAPLSKRIRGLEMRIYRTEWRKDEPCRTIWNGNILFVLWAPSPVLRVNMRKRVMEEAEQKKRGAIDRPGPRAHVFFFSFFLKGKRNKCWKVPNRLLLHNIFFPRCWAADVPFKYGWNNLNAMTSRASQSLWFCMLEKGFGEITQVSRPTSSAIVSWIIGLCLRYNGNDDYRRNHLLQTDTASSTAEIQGGARIYF